MKMRKANLVSVVAGMSLILLAGAQGQTEDDLALEKAVPGHVSEADIEKGLWTFSQLRKAGELLFAARFTVNDGAGRAGATGVGNPTRRPLENQPTFIRTAGPDANSCAGCHNQPAVGGAGDFVANVFVSSIAREPASYTVDPSITAERGTTAMNGSGLIEMLSREMTADLLRLKRQSIDTAVDQHHEVRTELVTHGVSFGWLTALPDGNTRLTEVTGIDKDLVVRPWSQKGTISSLRAFTVNALNQHHGMEATERFGIQQSGTRDFDRDGTLNELTEGDVTALVVYQASLNVPGRLLPSDSHRRELASRGEQVFSEVGCARCHIPVIALNNPAFSEPGPYNLEGTLRQLDVARTFRFDLRSEGPKPHVDVDPSGRALVRAFTDLKRHKICDADTPHFCNEKFVQGFVPPDQFITKRLWDVGNTAPYGHRGDLTTIREAILAHGGEAKSTRVAFENLPPTDQRAIVEFLLTLQILPEGSDPSVTAQPAEILPYTKTSGSGDTEDGPTVVQ